MRVDTDDPVVVAYECAIAALTALKRPCEVHLMYGERGQVSALRRRPHPAGYEEVGSRFDTAAASHVVRMTWSPLEADYSKNLREGLVIARESSRARADEA